MGGDSEEDDFGDDELGQVVVLFQCRATDLAARTRLKQDVAGLLQRSMGVDARVELVPPKGLPQTSSGKLSRAKAKTNYQQGHYADADLGISA